MERDWAYLEQGLLRDIFVRLPSDVDAVHFRRVCPGWRAAAGAGVHVPRPMFLLPIELFFFTILFLLSYSVHTLETQ